MQLSQKLSDEQKSFDWIIGEINGFPILTGKYVRFIDPTLEGVIAYAQRGFILPEYRGRAETVEEFKQVMKNYASLK